MTRPAQSNLFRHFIIRNKLESMRDMGKLKEKMKISQKINLDELEKRTANESD